MTVNHQVFISPHAQRELTQHFREFLYEKPEALWIINQLKDFLLDRLGASPESGSRQDAIHKGIRICLYGFYEIYYYFNGRNVYIAHVAYKKDMIH